MHRPPSPSIPFHPLSPRDVQWGKGVCMETQQWPACQKCGRGFLIPLSDYGRDGAPITYKAWVCTHPECGFNIRIDNGEISLGRTIGQSFK